MHINVIVFLWEKGSHISSRNCIIILLLGLFLLHYLCFNSLVTECDLHLGDNWVFFFGEFERDLHRLLILSFNSWEVVFLNHLDDCDRLLNVNICEDFTYWKKFGLTWLESSSLNLSSSLQGFTNHVVILDLMSLVVSSEVGNNSLVG